MAISYLLETLMLELMIRSWKHFFNAYYLRNLIKQPTCFKNPVKPIDLILANKSWYFQATSVIEKGLSDFHKVTMPVLKKIGALICYMKFLSSDFVLCLYKSTIWSCMEYCCHVWAGAPSWWFELLEKLQKNVYVGLLVLHLLPLMNLLLLQLHIFCLSASYIDNKCRVAVVITWSFHQWHRAENGNWPWCSCSEWVGVGVRKIWWSFPFLASPFTCFDFDLMKIELQGVSLPLLNIFPHRSSGYQWNRKPWPTITGNLLFNYLAEMTECFRESHAC